MAYKNFSKRTLDAIPLPVVGERASYYDTEVRGLMLRVYPTGNKVFYFYRKVNGRPEKIKIGRFPDLSIENARGKVSELNGQLARWGMNDFNGDNPLKRNRQKSTALTLRELIEAYIDRHVMANAKSSERGDRAAKYLQWQFRTYLSQYGSRQPRSFGRSELVELHEHLGRKHGKVTANRTIQLLRRIIYWAKEKDLWTGDNPAAKLSLFKESKRKRYLLHDEAPQFFQALRTEQNVDLRDCVLLALFTGVRRSSVLSMRWEDLSVESAVCRIPDPKGGDPYDVPLIPAAIQVLKERKGRVGGNVWIFPSNSKSGHLVDPKRAYRKLLNRAGIMNFTYHDLRRTLGSWQALSNISLTIIGKSLGHKSLAATEIYAQLDIEPVRSAVLTASAALMKAGRTSPIRLLDGEST